MAVNIQDSLDLDESILDAIREDVKALKGVKPVAKLLWPTKDEVTAQGRLRACIAPDHAQELGPEEIELILVQASKVGSYHIARYFARKAKGQFTPVEPRSRVEKLMDRVEMLESSVHSTCRELREAVADLKEHEDHQQPGEGGEMTADTHITPKISVADRVSNVAAPWSFQFEVRCPTEESYRKTLESLTDAVIRGFSIRFDTRNLRELPPNKIAVEPEPLVRTLR